MHDNFFDQVRTGYTFDDFNLEPTHSDIMSRKEVDLSSEIVEGVKVEVPIISANMNTITEHEMINAMCSARATGALHRFEDPDYLKREIAQVSKEYRNRIGVSVGANIEFADRLLGKVLDLNDFAFVIVDIAHGDHKHVENMVTFLKNNFKTPIIAGNICNAAGARFLIELGVDGIKVGVGPGSFCSTRIKTGCGKPQLSAIKEVADEIIKRTTISHPSVSRSLLHKKITLIADGGVKHEGDLVKAIAAGADSVMIAGMIKEAKETPGSIISLNEKDKDGKMVSKMYKICKGSASADAQIIHKEVEKKEISEEGVAILVERQGEVAKRINEIAKGMRSGFSYCGCRTVEELQDYGRMTTSWTRVTANGVKENHPHGV